MPTKYKVSAPEERTLDGILFDSKTEMLRYAELRILQAANQISMLMCQPQFKVEINGEHYCTYTADFEYFDNALETWVYEDVKSVATAKDPAFRLRQKAAELFHGILFVNVVKGAPLTRRKAKRKVKK
jgi:hypothetical protein